MARCQSNSDRLVWYATISCSVLVSSCLLLLSNPAPQSNRHHMNYCHRYRYLDDASRWHVNREKRSDHRLILRYILTHPVISFECHSIWYSISKNTVNTSRPSVAMRRHTSGSTLAQVVPYCLTAPNPYIDQFLPPISECLWHSPLTNFTARVKLLFCKWVRKLYILLHLPMAMS